MAQALYAHMNNNTIKILRKVQNNSCVGEQSIVAQDEVRK
jgi:hypothetical protein